VLEPAPNGNTDIGGDDAIRNLLHDYYQAMEAKDAPRFGAYYHPDMTLTFANNPTITGENDIVAVMTQMLGRVVSVHHDVLRLWRQDGGVVVFEVLATWTLEGGETVDVGACSICVLVDGKFVDQRIYVDNAPLFAALG
jgi:ketosteroid isomerase-like protein